MDRVRRFLCGTEAEALSSYEDWVDTLLREREMAELTPLLIMFAIFYFLLIRPQQKRQKKHQEMISRLKKGDMVCTNGGLVGEIFQLSDAELVLEVDSKTKIRVLRNMVNLYQPGPEDQGKDQ